MFKQQRIRAINDIVRGGYEKINVQPRTCRNNFQCHANAVHDAINDNHDKIALVVYFDEGYPIVHFVNVSEVGGGITEFTDNTLGQWSGRMEYYFVRYVDKIEFWDVYKIHKSFRQIIKNQLPFIYRMFHNLDFI